MYHSLFNFLAEATQSLDPIEPTDFKATFFKMMTSITLIVAVVFLILWLVKKFSANRFHTLNRERYIKVIEKRPISPKTMVYIVEIGNKQMLIAESQLEVEVLTHLEAFNEPSGNS